MESGAVKKWRMYWTGQSGRNNFKTIYATSYRGNNLRRRSELNGESDEECMEQYASKDTHDAQSGIL